MAVDLWPSSSRLGGVVTDLEHEALWGGFADGILPGQGAEAMAVYGYAFGGGVQVQPGRIRIAGHVLELTEPETVVVNTASSADRTDLIVAYINRSVTPWAKGVKVITGVPGGSRPAVTQSATGYYEVVLRPVIRRTNNSLDLGADERPWLSKSGLRVVSANLSIPPSLTTFPSRGPARAYRYESNGMTWVYINGAVRRSDNAAWSAAQRAGGVMATIPAGFRPTYNVTIATSASSAFARLEVQPSNGQMQLFTSTAGSNWVSLAGSFPIL